MTLGGIEFLKVLPVGHGYKKPLQNPAVQVGDDEGQIDRIQQYVRKMVSHVLSWAANVVKKLEIEHRFTSLIWLGFSQILKIHP